MRQNAERYRCYITDLDMPDEGQRGPLSTVQLLQRKAALEDELNRALLALD